MSYGVTRKVSGAFTAYADASAASTPRQFALPCLIAFLTLADLARAAFAADTFASRSHSAGPKPSDQLYWTVTYGVSDRMGLCCRECRATINKGERYACRDGRRIRMCYHLKCFSGEADPRTQRGSSYHTGSLKDVISEAAPERKGAGKFSVSQYGLSNGLAANARSGSLPAIRGASR